MANLLSTNVSGRLYVSTQSDVNSTGGAFRFYDGSAFRGGLGLDDWAHSGSAANIVMYVNGDNNFFISTSGVKRAQFNSGAAIFRTYSPDTNYNIRVTGGDQFNAYYGDNATTMYINWNGGQTRFGTGGIRSGGDIVSDGIAYLNNYTKISYDWGGGQYGAEQLTIRGTHPSIALRSTNANFKWLLHTDASGNFRWYTGSELDDNAWTNRFTFGTDNNFYVDYGHVYVSGGNSVNWNTAYGWGNHASAGYQSASTAINTGNIGSQSVSVARQLLSPNNASVVAADSALPSAGHSFIHTLALGPGGNDGHILGMTWANTTTSYGAQIFIDTDPNDIMAIRSRSAAGVWTGWKTVIHSGTIGSQSVSYASTAGNSATTSQTVFNDLKTNFPSGSGGGHSFGSNHYSMGLDSGNGGWDGPHYRDLIIGYHTGIRIGANYSGIRFYDNSPTRDANNDGNGDGGERLLMTIGGYVGTANHTDVVVNNNLIANSSLRAPIFYDSENTGFYLDPNGSSRLAETLTDQNYTFGWYRNHGSYGLYNNSHGNHFYATNDSQWNIAANGGTPSIAFKSGGYEGTLRGYVYADSGNAIGFLNNAGEWSLRTDSSKNAQLYGNRFNIEGAAGQVTFKDADNVWTGSVGFDGNLGVLSFPGRNVRINSGYSGTIELNTGTDGYNDGVISVPYGRLHVDRGYISAPIYYDANDGAYYTNPASSSRMRNLYVGDAGSDWVDTGGWGTQFHVSNGPHSIFKVFARNEGIETGMFSHVGGQSKAGSFSNHDFAIVRNWDTKMTFYSGYTYANGYLQAADSLRAPIFYDSNDTTFYVDPASTSNLNLLTDITRARWGMPSWVHNRTNDISDSGYWTGTNGWGTSYGTWREAWRGGFSGWDIWGTDTDHPQGGGYIHAQGIVSGQHYANSSQGHGWMMVGSHAATNNRYWLRGKWGTETSGWVEMITTGNIGSQSVSYATSAGNADTVDGFHKEAFPYRAGGTSGYYQVTDWLQFNTSAGLYWPDHNGAHIYPNTTGAYGSIRIDGSRNNWAGIYFGYSGNTLMANANDSGFYNANAGWQVEWYNGTLYVSKQANGGGTLATVLDSSNYSSWAQPASTAINTGNIADQSVSYASAASDAKTLDGLGSSRFLYTTTDVFSGDWGTLTDGKQEIRLVEVHNITGGAHSNHPTGLYTYGSVLGWQLNNSTFKLYNSHTGDLAFQTGWNNDGYSGWRTIIHSANIGSQSVNYAASAGAVAWGNITSVPSSFTPSSHTHDDRYYTESEVNTLLAGKLSTSGKAADAETVDGIDSSRIVYGQNERRTTRVDGDGIVSRSQNSGFYYGYDPDGGPYREWWNWLTVAGASWTSNDNYDFKLAHDFHSDSFYVSRMANGAQYGWRQVIDSGNIGSQSVSNADTVDGYHASDFPYRLNNSHYQTNNWIQFNAEYGLYWPNNYDTHLHANHLSSYTQLAIRGSKNSYGGIYDQYSGVNGFMYDSSGNGGVYREGTGRWYLYHHVGNNCMGVGTSTTSGSYRLYVAGGIYATGDVVAYSDSRKKTNVVTIDNALNKVLSMRGVFYDKIGEPENGRQVGVIAQEVNEVLPEVVNYASDIDEYGVKYGNITAVLIEAIKEQQKQIDELKEIINGLTK